jgi:hypothetical protein
LTATYMASYSASSTFEVFVTVGSVVAVIDGGSERGVRAGSVVAISAANSFDTDVAPGSPSSLAFSWESSKPCIQMTQIFRLELLLFA